MTDQHPADDATIYVDPVTGLPDTSVLGRPDSYIGRSVPRPNAKRLVAGRGRYVDDLTLPRMLHIAFVRSPYAHARIVSIDSREAATMPGVVRIVTATDLADICTPWVGVLTHMKGLKSAPQHPLAVDRACWQGEPVAAVLADSRAEAEDAAALIEVDYEELPAAADAETALDPQTPVIHPELGDNLAFENALDIGDVDAAFAAAARDGAVVEQTFSFARQTGVTLEPRVLLADWNAAEGRMTAWMSSQVPYMMQDLISKHLGIAPHDVRVVCRDVGGSFGLKIHTYPDEMTTLACSKLMRRPVKFVADRIEAFGSDIHARAHRVTGRIAMAADGEILAFDIDDLTGVGPYSVYPRTSAMEATQVLNYTGAPYAHRNYRARVRVVFQNKVPMCQYRAVGHPIAFAVGEGLVDAAARKLGLDPAAVRRKNLIADDAYPLSGVSGIRFEGLSHHASLDKILAMMDYDALVAEREAARTEGKLRGIGLAAMIELTNPGAASYGIGGARISSTDGTAIKMDAAGALVVQTSGTEQGQGLDTVVAQVAASAFGVPMDRVRVISGDTDNTPYGGGTWGSRATGIAGESALRAARALRHNVLDVAGALLQAEPATLDIRAAKIVDKADGAERLPLEEVARVAYFRPDTLPAGFQAEMMATRHYVPKDYPVAFTNGMQASYVEVDPETGFVTLLGHWVVEDCGTVINPQLVDEQVRGGVVMGIAGALYEECAYDGDGNLLNATLADYLVPMAGEMPDIAVGHVSTPTRESELGAKGAGEAGTAGAPAAILNAINDALASEGASVWQQPVTPERVLEALGLIAQ
jgi:carbon-monoxide dehydrogenase large subunit